MKLSKIMGLMAVLCLPFCSSDPQKGTCSCSTTVIAESGAFERPGGHLYFNVIQFDAQNKDCYTYLREFANDAARKCKLPVTVHFLHNVPTFEPPADGRMYGSEEIRKRVIFQYSLSAEMVPISNFDPEGFGTYIEPR